MKNTYKLLVAFVAILGFWSCDNETDLMILEAQEADFAIITPDAGSKVILNKATPDNTALTLTWEKVSYGAPTIVTYTVEFAKSGTDFAAPVEINSTSNSFATIKVSELNTKALDFGLTPEVEGTIDIRIKSTVGTTGSQPKYSKAISIVVTPYSVAEPTLDLYLVGDATLQGWNGNNDNIPLFKDLSNAKKYYYTGYFKVGEFKMLSKLGEWTNVYGTDGTKVVLGDGSVGNFKITVAGYYTFEINLEDMSFNLASYTLATTSYTTLDVNGTSFDGGWSKTYPMAKSDWESHIWKITINTLKGEFLFSGDNWKNKWGADGTTSNIPTSEGKYDIWFNDLDGRYTFIVAQ